jgi:hypothetical protein
MYVSCMHNPTCLLNVCIGNNIKACHVRKNLYLIVLVNQFQTYINSFDQQYQLQQHIIHTRPVWLLGLQLICRIWAAVPAFSLYCAVWGPKKVEATRSNISLHTIPLGIMLCLIMWYVELLYGPPISIGTTNNLLNLILPKSQPKWAIQKEYVF